MKGSSQQGLGGGGAVFELQLCISSRKTKVQLLNQSGTLSAKKSVKVYLARGLCSENVPLVFPSLQCKIEHNGESTLYSFRVFFPLICTEIKWEKEKTVSWSLLGPAIWHQEAICSPFWLNNLSVLPGACAPPLVPRRTQALL